MNIEKFIAKAYEEALQSLLWTEVIWVTDDDPEDVQDMDGNPFGEFFQPEDLDDVHNEFWEQVCDFVWANWDDVKRLSPAKVGHNFVLSKNGHGAGFWDLGLGELGDRLHKASKSYGNTLLMLEGKDKVTIYA